MNIPMHTRCEPRTVPLAMRRGDSPGNVHEAAPATRPGSTGRGGAKSGWAASPATGRVEGPSGRAALGVSTQQQKLPARGSSWNELPSSRLKSVKCANPFASKSSQFKTKFGSVYNAGGIPVRLQHGAVNVSLKWGKEVPRAPAHSPALLAQRPARPAAASAGCSALTRAPAAAGDARLRPSPRDVRGGAHRDGAPVRVRGARVLPRPSCRRGRRRQGRAARRAPGPVDPRGAAEQQP
jgi:hypothetical protein